MKYRYLRFPEGREKAVTFSYDDGNKSDIRLAEIFSSYGMKCTFNITARGRTNPALLTTEEGFEHILGKEHEIALHGAEHRALGAARAIDGIREILDCRLYLEKEYGRIIRGYAYSDFGIARYFNGASYESVRSYLSDLDIAYARALGELNSDFTLPTDWLRWHPNAHHDNADIFEKIDKFLAIKVSEGYVASRYPRLLYIWGHSFEFDNKDNWNRITEICEKLSGKDDIWYATNMEIYEYVTAYNSLVYSADGLRVYNPTLKTIWFDVDGVLYSIAPGEELIIG